MGPDLRSCGLVLLTATQPVGHDSLFIANCYGLTQKALIELNMMSIDRDEIKETRDRGLDLTVQHESHSEGQNIDIL